MKINGQILAQATLIGGLHALQVTDRKIIPILLQRLTFHCEMSDWHTSAAELLHQWSKTMY